jgi:VCBS repeat-containing protein
MISLPSVRKGLQNLSLGGLTAIAVVSVAVAATAGFPFTEDFTADNLKDAATTADWDTTAPGTLRLGFANELTGVTYPRTTLGNAGEVTVYNRDIVLGDIDGDGDLDAVAGNAGPGNTGATNSIYVNNGGAFDLAPVQLGSDPNDTRRTRGMAIGDLDLDGDLDVVAGNFQGTNVYYLNDGAGNFTDGSAIGTVNRRTWRVALVDVDGDGDLDIIDAVDGAQNALYKNQLVESAGTLSFAAGTTITGEVFATRSLATGDVDNDGDIDFIAGDLGAGNHIYRWFDGSFRARGEAHVNTNTTFAVALADVDGDGWLDLIEGNAGAATLVYLNQGAGNPGFFGGPTAIGDSNPLHTTVSLIARDVDRDGDIDIIEGNNGAWDDNGDAGAGETCLNPGASTPCVGQPVRLFLNNGNGTFANGIDTAPPTIQKIYGSAAGDINGDDQLDFVTAHSSNNPGGPDASGNSAVYFNGGTANGPSSRQLDSMALSLEVDGGTAAIPDARLTVTRAQSTAAVDMNWYLSNDGGGTFIPVTPGVPVAFPNPNGNALKWRVEVLSASSDTSLAEVSSINIAANQRPDYNNQGDLNGAEGQNFQADLSTYFSDPDGDTLTYQVSGLPAGTGLSLNATTGILSGVPTNDDAVNSPIALRLFAFDGAGSRAGNIALTITNAINNPPVAVDDGPFAIDEGGAIASTFRVLDNDTDPDTNNADLNAVLGTPPANSALFELKPDGTFDYTHNGTETTTDSFTYRADDGTSVSDAATVSITINPVNDQPVITLIGDATVDIKQGDLFRPISWLAVTP